MTAGTTEATARSSDDFLELFEELHDRAHRDPWVILNEAIQRDRENNYAWDRWLAEHRRPR